VALLLLAFAACQRSPDAQTNRSGATNFSTADIAQLKWIEGTWRGSGVDQAPFFERYRFENDSTLAVDTFPDEKLDKVEDTSRFELKDGRFGSSHYIASSIEDNAINFEPLGNAKNSFRWERVSDNAWKATLKWPAQGDKPARETYLQHGTDPKKVTNRSSIARTQPSWVSSQSVSVSALTGFPPLSQIIDFYS
jgi:hypothetical protein